MSENELLMLSAKKADRAPVKTTVEWVKPRLETRGIGTERRHPEETVEDRNDRLSHRPKYAFEREKYFEIT
jgi:hypothetical protein